MGREKKNCFFSPVFRAPFPRPQAVTACCVLQKFRSLSYYALQPAASGRLLDLKALAAVPGGGEANRHSIDRWMSEFFRCVSGFEPDFREHIGPPNKYRPNLEATNLPVCSLISRPSWSKRHLARKPAPRCRTTSKRVCVCAGRIGQIPASRKNTLNNLNISSKPADRMCAQCGQRQRHNSSASPGVTLFVLCKTGS